ncbi:protein kinase [Inhella sp.]|uniref:protein kinase domain-containing protein n=1 Tax=Inhella sp. TaxID=1921806 RepID=UPI0035B412AC
MNDAGDSIFEDPNALPGGTRFGELEIIRTLGVGGFGIVYLAQDHALERRVAVKEYMPAQLAQRGNSDLVSVRSAQHRETFELGLRSFVNEARMLARFDHPSLLKVYRFWEANGTAYMVMPYLQGKTLKRIRDGLADPPSESWILKQVMPLLDALALLHDEKVYHRDISPDNILLPSDGGDPILLDFGAARRVIGDRTQTFTAIFKPSYAPIEQYGETTQLRQGPWTDIYALGAVLHFLLTGTPPPLATTRAVIDEFVPLANRSDWPGHSRHFRSAIDWALAVRPADRPRTVDELRKALLGERTMPLIKANEAQGLDGDDSTVVLERPKPRAKPDPAVPGDAFAPTQLVAPPRPTVEAVPVPSDKERTQPLGTESGFEPTQPHPLADAASPAAPKPRQRAAVKPPAPALEAAGTGPTRIGGRQRLWLGLGLGVAAVMLGGFWWLLQGRQAPSGPEGLVVSIEPAARASEAGLAASQATSAVADAATALPGVTAASVPPDAVPAQGSAPDSAIPVRPAPPRPVAAASKPSVVSAAPPPRPVRQESPSPEPAAAARTEAPAPSLPIRPAGPQDPRAACGDRVLFALWRCMEQRCEEPAFAEHPECRQLAERRERRREQRGH